MKTLLDRADAALKLRLQKLKRGYNNIGGGFGGYGSGGKVESGMEGLVDELSKAQIAEKRGQSAGVAAAGGAGGDEWEVLSEGGVEEDEVAIRVDQYLVVFLKVSVVPLMCILQGFEGESDLGVVHGERYSWNRTRLYNGSLMAARCTVYGRLV